MRRMAWNNMLDPQQLHVTQLDQVEIAAVSSFLAANQAAIFGGHMISQVALQDLLAISTVETVDPDVDAERASPFTLGSSCERCTVVLQGRLHIVCGPEGFESDRGPWTVLGAPAMRRHDYRADFSARVMETSRLLQISRADYDEALAKEEGGGGREAAPAEGQGEGRFGAPAIDLGRGSPRREVVLRAPHVSGLDLDLEQPAAPAEAGESSLDLDLEHV